MISPIPNQPINFLPASVITECPDKRIPLIAGDEDTLRFQVAIDAPSGSGPYGYGNEVRNWEVVFDWGGTGAWVNYVQGWLCAVEPGPGAYIQPVTNPFNPTIGVVYQIVVELPSISGTSTFTMGGQSFVLSAPGSTQFLLVAATTDGPRITLDTDDSRICVERVRIFDVIGGTGSCVITAQLLESETDVVLMDLNSNDDLNSFVISVGAVSVSMPLSTVEDDIQGRCVYVRISSNCSEDGALCSQPIRVGDCRDTVVIRACLDHDAMGFDAPAIFETRLKASLVRPRWEFDSSEERWSDGTINRYYIDRQRTMDLMIQPVDELLHPFLAALCMFDHVFIDATEYSVDADGYEPAYGDLTATAAVSLTVRPKRELMRRVTCDAPGPGCAPQDDPPCPRPNAHVSYAFEEDDGLFNVFVNVYSAIGFIPDRVRMYVDDVLTDDVAWTTPTLYTFGPVAGPARVTVEITSLDVPECDWTDSFGIPFPPCGGASFEILNHDLTTVMRLLTSTDAMPGLKGFYRQRAPDGTISDAGGTTGTTVEVNFGEDGQWCISPSSVFVNNEDFTLVEFEGDAFVSLDCSAMTGMAIGRFVITNTPNLPFATLPTFNAACLYLDLTGITLSSDQVDVLCILFDAFGTSSGTLKLDGADHGAPTAASLAARNALLGRSWTVDVN